MISLAYRHALVRYIDFNPVEAGLVPLPAEYPHGSARHFASTQGPPWLERSWVEGLLPLTSEHGGAAYTATFGKRLAAGMSELVERRLAGGRSDRDPLDDLLAATPPAVLSWMKRKARLADDSRAGMALCDAASIQASVEELEAATGPWFVMPARKRLDAWLPLRVGLLRDIAGLSGSRVSLHLAHAESTVSLMYKRHQVLIEEDPIYGQRASHAAAVAWERSDLVDSARIVSKLS